MKLFFKLLILTTLIGNYSTSAFADFEDKIVSSLIEHGKFSINKNDIAAAIDDFSRALLLDSDNDIAIKELLKTSSNKDLPFDIKLSILQLEDISKYIARLNEVTNYYSDRIINIKDKLLSEGVSEDVIKKELGAILPIRTIIDEQSELNTEHQSISTKDPLSNLLIELTSVKLSLEDKASLLRTEYELLMSINDKLTIAKNNEALNRSEAKYASKTETLSEIEDAKDNKTSGLDGNEFLNKNFAKTSSTLNEFSQQLEILKSELENKDLAVKRMSSQIVDMSLQLAEDQNNKSKEETTSTPDLHFEITDLNSRLELGQKILQEKNEQINILRRDITKIKEIATLDENKYNESLTIKNKKLVEQSGILRIYKEQYWDTYKENKSNIANIKTLEAQIDFAQKMIFEKERIINNFKQNMVSFENQLFEAKSKL
ncbi:MAG: hypothetical protein KKF78_08255, partial [Candidatus Omnitrophica bacterium]|nr:hypothetical protein [Candidatus Omnitrophota bacterium]